MKVQEIIDAILADSPVLFNLEKTCDLLMTGKPNTEVTGIVTTFMATIDVIKETIACGANMIVTHEPTFYTGCDNIEWLQNDPLYIAKMKLIDDHNIAIWRYHDHMHMTETDRIYDGLLKELGWEKYLMKHLPVPHVYEIPDTTLADMAKFFKEKLQMDVVQIVGNPDMKCKKAGILVGGGSLGLGREEMPMELMQKENLDVIVCGDITEWTLCSYVNDAQMLGMNKAMLVVGHERSEEWGMKYMAEWLQPLVSGIPVTFVDAKEPFQYL